MSFSGFIEEIPGLSVDSFREENFEKSSTFFLTHCHTDHTTGLINGFLNHIYANSNLILYCSSESATILKNMNPEHTNLLDNIIWTLPFNQNCFIPINGMSVGVTAIRANHCVGSCMFLFRTNESTVLYTGDFRFHWFELMDIKALHNNGWPIQLDNVYLDTTYLKQITYNFPTRKKAIHLLLNAIDDFLEFTAGQRIVHISRPANIGSEIIIQSLARKFNCQIHVDDECYNFYRGVEPVFSCMTNNPNNTFIHMCKPGKPGTNHFCNSPAALKIRLSAQWYAIQENTNWVQWEGARAVNIAHSMHSSRKELKAFLRYFKPGCAVALVIPDGYYQDEIQVELDYIACKAYNN
ncbi:protein artemis-like [Cloeon dipterum]|uniref:protein artemis-like n=1 Tax=Cloeon dipterum TaxID=197152 RepID=UPI00321FB5BF